MRRSPEGQIWVLLAASYCFYAWWRVDFLLLLAASSLADWAIGLAMGRARDNETPDRPLERTRRALLLLSLGINLGRLAFFKYAGWMAEEWNALLGVIGLEMSPAMTAFLGDVILPVGISFYTFQTLSYTIDVYRGRLLPCRSLPRYLLFVAAFPQLVAGPIVRASEFLPQCKGNLLARCDPSGLWRIAMGLAKKSFLADPLGLLLVDPVFNAPHEHGPAMLLLGIYGFAFQIFLDFSAYSDIAIGLGRLMGLRFPENFNAPYLARNPSEFWGRWHISLSTWFRDYVYIPLGGSQSVGGRVLFNLMLTMLLSGLWHGAGRTFLVWGALHGLYLCVHRLLRPWLKPGGALGMLHRAPRALTTLAFFQLVCLAWVFFRAADMPVAMTILQGLVAGPWGLPEVSPAVWLLLAGALGTHLWLEPRRLQLLHRASRLHWGGIVLVFMLIFAGRVLLAELDVGRQAFIYFQF